MRILTILLLCLSQLACSEEEAQAPKIPEVFVVIASEQPYHPSRTYNAKIQSSSDVDIEAEVSGKLIAVYFKEGDQVKKGVPLFKIDPEPYIAELERTKPDLETAITDLKIKEKYYERGKVLVAEGHISELDFDGLKARKLKAESEVESVQAALDIAQINVDRATIKAPIEGRIGRSIPAIGDLVGPDSGALTTLVGEGDMQVVFQLPERLILRVKSPDSNFSMKNIVVSLVMENGAKYAHTSRIDYFSNRVDPATGTVETRVNIPNPDDLLRPGMFVRALLSLEKPVQSLVIPQAAVQVDQLGSYVFIADSSDKVVRKNIETDDRIGENVVIINGLNTGERVILRGIQRVRPGDTVMVSDFVPGTGASEGKVQ